MNKSLFFKSLCFGLALSLVLAAPCITIYTYNPFCFSFTLAYLGIALTILSLSCCFAVCALRLAANNWPHIRKVEFLIVVVCALVWLQGGVFATILPTMPIEADFGGNLLFLSFMQVLAFAFVIGVMVFFRRFIQKHIMRVLLFVILCHLVTIGVSIYQFYPRYPYNKVFSNCFEENNKYTFGAGENVLLIVVDCLGSELFKEELKKYPELEELFKDFTCLEGMRSPLPRTMAAIPAMLTGMTFKYGIEELGCELYPKYLLQAFLENQTLMHHLKAEGFRCEGYQFMPNIALATETCFDNAIPRLKHNASDVIMFQVWCQRMMPYFMHSIVSFKWDARKMFVNEVNTGRIRNMNLKYDQAMNQRLVKEFLIGRTEKAFKYYHLQGAHVALSTNEFLEDCEDTDKYRQLRGSLIFLENLFFLLKENNLYDNATIVVTGDHTEDYQPEVATLVKAPGTIKDNMDFDNTSYVLADMPGIIQKLRGKPQESSDKTRKREISSTN